MTEKELSNVAYCLVTLGESDNTNWKVVASELLAHIRNGNANGNQLELHVILCPIVKRYQDADKEYRRWMNYKQDGVEHNMDVTGLLSELETANLAILQKCLELFGAV